MFPFIFIYRLRLRLSLLPTEPREQRRGKVKIANVIAKSSEQVNSLKLKISISAGFVVVFFEIMLSCRLHWNIQISILFAVQMDIPR